MAAKNLLLFFMNFINIFAAIMLSEKIKKIYGILARKVKYRVLEKDDLSILVDVKT